MNGSSANFDLVAGPYAMLERIVFGEKLQQARLGHIDLIAKARRILLTGDGDGRFLEALVKKAPTAEIVSVDSSQRMLAKAARRIGISPDSTSCRVRFVQGDLLRPPESGLKYDAVVSHFVLDCFTTAQVAEMAKTIAGRLDADGFWVVTDFQRPAKGEPWGQRLFSLALLRTMYLFFRFTTGLRALQIPDYAKAMQGEGFDSSMKKPFMKGFVTSVVHRPRLGLLS